MERSTASGEAVAAGPFSAPGHDHHACASALTARAERLCAERGLWLTPLRRHVLEALGSTHRPIGAYELIGMLEDGEGHRPAPITVYRALEFLLENGLAHRLESKNAFVACGHSHEAEGVILFMICERCGAVGEEVSAGVGASIAIAARNVGFRPRAQLIEIAGVCAHCAAAG